MNQKKAVSLGLTPMYNTYLSTYLSKKLKVYVDNATKTTFQINMYQIFAQRC